MSVKTYSALLEGNKVLSPHFKVKEFACKDGSDTILIESGLTDVLEQVFRHFGCSKINITSGYRTPTHDKKVGGKGSGNHVEGKAADFVAYDKSGDKIPSAKIVLYLEDIGVKGIGYRCGGGEYATHIDVNYRANKWYGDEKISMSKNIWDIKSGCRSFYDYLGVFRTYRVKIICSALNIRSGAGTGYTVVGTYKRGETAEILSVNAAKSWGKTDSGWICLNPSYSEAI